MDNGAVQRMEVFLTHDSRVAPRPPYNLRNMSRRFSLPLVGKNGAALRASRAYHSSGVCLLLSRKQARVASMMASESPLSLLDPNLLPPASANPCRRANSSPLFRYLLQQWSADPDKLKYLSLWLRCVIERRKVGAFFPPLIACPCRLLAYLPAFLSATLPLGGYAFSRICPPLRRKLVLRKHPCTHALVSFRKTAGIVGIFYRTACKRHTRFLYIARVILSVLVSDVDGFEKDGGPTTGKISTASPPAPTRARPPLARAPPTFVGFVSDLRSGAGRVPVGVAAGRACSRDQGVRSSAFDSAAVATDDREIRGVPLVL